MKNHFKFTGLVFIILIVILHSCKKEIVPTLTTTAVTNITGTKATSGGTISDEGSGTVVERGICWSKGITPTVSDKITVEGGGVGTFVSNMSELDAATTYYVRAYAKNDAGIGYGMAVSFITLGQAPSATTQSATNVTAISATLNGVVNANYLSTTCTFEYGTTTSFGQTVTATQSPVTGNSNSNVTADLTGLAPGTTYHFRVKTVNSLGTTNGNDLSFTTLGQAPTAITQAACCLSSTGAKLNGSVNPNYLSTTITFEYGLTTAYGSTIAATPSPVTGNSSTSVGAVISGLNSNTIYHFRIKAVNSLGTTYGNDAIFTTLYPPPPTNGLVAYYPLNGNANDESGNNLNGTVYGATLTTNRNGTSNKAYYFDGATSYIRILSNALLSLPTFTISAWVNCERFDGSGGETGEILIKGIYPNFNFVLNASKYTPLGNNAFATEITSNGNILGFNSNAVNANIWYLVVVTNDGSNLQVFVNAVSNGLLPAGTADTNGNDLFIGRYEGDMRYNFKGKIDDIRIYNRALTADEISSLYHEIP